MSRAALKSRAEKGRTSSVPPPPNSQSPDLVEIVPGLLTESSWISMLGQEDGEEVVLEILEEVMSCVMDKCYSVYIQRQLEPFTVSWARDALVQVVEWHFVVQDQGDGPGSALAEAEDSEPLPSVPDSWAEGCVKVKRVKTPGGFSSLQRSSPVGQTSGQQDRTDSRTPRTDSQLSSSTNPPRDDRKPTEPSSVRGFKRAPAPPTIPKRRQSRKPRIQLPATTEARLTSPTHSLNKSVKEEEETSPQRSDTLKPQKHVHTETSPQRSAKLQPQKHVHTETSPQRSAKLHPQKHVHTETSPQRSATLQPQKHVHTETSPQRSATLQPQKHVNTETSPQTSAKLQPQPADFPPIQRLDLSRLPGHRIWPQYEVLEISPSKHYPCRPRGSEPQNSHKQLSTQTKAVKPLTSYECPPWTQRRCALTGEVYLSTGRRVAKKDNSEGIVPFNGSLMLDSMELAPGVTLKGPQGIRFSPLKVCPTEPKHNGKLKPIQNYLAVPQFSLEQVTARSVPQVTPLL